MIVDTSAMAAILFKEPEEDSFIQAIHDTAICRISAANYVELHIVVAAQWGEAASRQCDNFLHRSKIIIEPVTVEQALIARQAYADFGKGRHAAGLNYGDCFAYALAMSMGEPLLFKGKDFSQTDIPSAK